MVDDGEGRHRNCKSGNLLPKLSNSINLGSENKVDQKFKSLDNYLYSFCAIDIILF